MYVLCMYVWVHSKVRGGGKKATAAVVIVVARCNNDRRCCSRAQFAVARSRWTWSSPSGNWVVFGRVVVYVCFVFGGILSLLSKESGRRRSGNNPIPKPIAVSLGVAQLLLLNVDSRRNAEILAFFTPKVSIRSDRELEVVTEFVPEFWVCGILLRSGSTKALKLVMGCAQ